MQALLYGDGVDAAAVGQALDDVLARVLAQPVRLEQLPDPVPGPDEVVLAPLLVGVCGSDVRLLLGDFSADDLDNPMAAFSELPFVLGHEAVGEVVDAGEDAGVDVGQRVALNPWLTCAPRRLPLCEACVEGQLARCASFLDPGVGPGLHVGVARGAPGAFATRVRANASQLHRVPDGVPDAAAVLADPFAVSLHAVLANPPPRGGRALVVGAGSLGSTCAAVLGRWHPDVEVGVVARYAHQAAAATRLGASRTFAHEPAAELLEQVANWSHATLRRGLAGLPMSYPGGVDVVYDTVASAATLEVGVRALRAGGTLVVLGVSTPRRFEWTPLYFKELRVVGSSGFGIECVDGERRHALEHYLDACASGLDLSWLVTHVEPLERWPQLCAALLEPERSKVLKAAFAPGR